MPAAPHRVRARAPRGTEHAPPASCGAPANPWAYTFCGGSLIRTAPRGFCSVFLCVAHFQEQKRADYVAECNDGAYAQATHGDASCLSHGGEMRPLYQPTGTLSLLARRGTATARAIH